METPAQYALAHAVAVQTQTLQAALKTKNSDGRHSVVKVNPTFKWPRLGDDGPDSKDVEEFYEKNMRISAAWPTTVRA